MPCSCSSHWSRSPPWPCRRRRAASYLPAAVLAGTVTVMTPTFFAPAPEPAPRRRAAGHVGRAVHLVPGQEEAGGRRAGSPQALVVRGGLGPEGRGRARSSGAGWPGPAPPGRADAVASTQGSSGCAAWTRHERRSRRRCCRYRAVAAQAGLALDAAARGRTGRPGGLDEVVRHAGAVADGVDLRAAGVVEGDAPQSAISAATQGDVRGDRRAVGLAAARKWPPAATMMGASAGRLRMVVVAVPCTSDT